MDDLHAFYAQGLEKDRLATPLGVVECERTREILARGLPPPPAVVADIGGGPGAYAVWLAREGYTVHHRDVVPLHVEQCAEAALAAGVAIDSAVVDARDVDLADGAADAILLLGPLYHLPARDDRLRALAEARRVGRPGGHVFVAAISRWAARLHGMVVARVYEQFPAAHDVLPQAERSGWLPPLFPGSFTAYAHRPDELRGEIADAGLDCLDLVSVEGIAFALADLEARLADHDARAVVFDAARALERVPELLGVGPHLLVTARRPA